MSKPVIEMWEISRIKPYEQNVKIHDAKQIEKIAASIKKFKWKGNPIVVNADGVILAGHGRRLAALKLGMSKVPVVVEKDMTPEEERAYRLSDNRVAVGGIDSEMLQLELSTLEEIDLTDIYDKKELDFLEVDLTSMNTELFVDNLNDAVAGQEVESELSCAAAKGERVPIVKALGFKDIAGADQIHINRFMAQVEANTGKTGADAFVDFIKRLMEASVA